MGGSRRGKLRVCVFEKWRDFSSLSNSQWEEEVVLLNLNRIVICHPVLMCVCVRQSAPVCTPPIQCVQLCTKCVSVISERGICHCQCHLVVCVCGFVFFPRRLSIMMP